MMPSLLDNIWSVVKGGVAGGLLQDDSDLINTYVPQQLQQGMTDEERQMYANKIRSVGAAGLLSRGVDAQERTRAIQQGVLGDLLTKQQQAQQAQEQSAVSDYMGKLMQPTVTPEMAIGASGQAGPTQAKAALIGAQNPYSVDDPMKARAMAYREFAAKFDVSNPAKAEQYRKAANMIDPTPEAYTLSEGQTRFVGNKPLASVAPKDSENRRLTGAVGNLALTMFGTNDVGTMSPEQLQAVDAEARKRNLERPPSISMKVEMPSESERTAGFLTQRLQAGLGSLAKASGIDPASVNPNLGAETIKRLTGSDVLKNMTNSSQRQVVEAAQLEILDSALTLGTGAAYTREQLDAYRQTYFPQIGDTPDVITDKQSRLNNLLSAARIKAGRAMPSDVGLPKGVTVERVKK